MCCPVPPDVMQEEGEGAFPVVGYLPQVLSAVHGLRTLI
ncbi:protein of unknown function [Rhodovastum atsumiense]|nr:protein of unknown function [Rhodovastum atsumiense]